MVVQQPIHTGGFLHSSCELSVTLQQMITVRAHRSRCAAIGRLESQRCPGVPWVIFHLRRSRARERNLCYPSRVIRIEEERERDERKVGGRDECSRHFFLKEMSSLLKKILLELVTGTQCVLNVRMSVTFDQCNASLLHKSIRKKKKSVLMPNFWTVEYIHMPSYTHIHTGRTIGGRECIRFILTTRATISAHSCMQTCKHQTLRMHTHTNTHTCCPRSAYMHLFDSWFHFHILHYLSTLMFWCCHHPGLP